MQQVEHAFDARLAEGTEPPEVWPADSDGTRAQRQRLDDIGAAPEAGIDQHGNAAVDRLDDLGQASMVERPLSSARRGDQLVERARAPHRGSGRRFSCASARAARAISGLWADGSCSSRSRRVWVPADDYCRSAQPIMRAIKPSQASICDLATNSLGWWACEMSPGPQITVGMPWPRKMPASVP